MKHRIRAAAIVLKDETILLVRHRTLDGREEWWIPPGGGIEPEDSTIMDCAQRETWEETGVQVKCDRIAYIREFRNTVQSIRHMEFFMVAQAPEGEITLAHLPDQMSGRYRVMEAQWLTKAEIQNITVFPEILKHEEFWQDAAQGFPQVKYLQPAVY